MYRRDMLTVLRRLVQLIQLFPDREANEHGDGGRVSPVGRGPGRAGAGGAGGHRPPLTEKTGKDESHEHTVSAGHRRGGGGADTGDRGGDPPVTDEQERKVIA